jgi:hypothetical protein
VDRTIEVHAGQELTTFRGHALALGPERWIDWRGGPRRAGHQRRRARRPRAGESWWWPIPTRRPIPLHRLPVDAADFDPALAHAVEVWGGLWDGPEERNAGCLALFHRWLNAGHRLAATGATDAHRHEDWQGAVPLTYVYAEDAWPACWTRCGRRPTSAAARRSEVEARGAGRSRRWEEPPSRRLRRGVVRRAARPASYG